MGLSFDDEPIAAASLGPMHRAALRDGRQGAVKVHRPNIRGGLALDTSDRPARRRRTSGR